jgi:hypothetical protein
MEFLQDSFADRLAHYAGIVHRHAKDHFIPHEGNDHVPHLLKHRVLFGYSAIIALLKVLVIVVPIALPAASVFSNSITVTNVIELTNAAREKLGLADLKENAKLDAAAAAKANDMIANGYFAHTSPTGVTGWFFIKQAGYAYRSAGENLAVHYTTAEGLHEGWMASPTHKANIVSTKYRDIGVGVVQGEYGGYHTIMVVQMFGLLASAPAPAPKPVAVATPPAPAPAPAPKPAAPPAPSPVIVASAPPAAPEPPPAPPVEPLSLDESGLLIVPGEHEYRVEAPMTGAVSASLSLGSATAPLTETSAGRWTGSIAYDAAAIPAGGEDLSLSAAGKDGTNVYQTLVTVAPQARTNEVYAFVNDPAPKAAIAGVTIDDLDDGVHRFYVYTIIFLSAAMLLAMLHRIHRKRLSVVAHTMLVIALAVVLMKI